MTLPMGYAFLPDIQRAAQRATDNPPETVLLSPKIFGGILGVLDVGTGTALKPEELNTRAPLPRAPPLPHPAPVRPHLPVRPPCALGPHLVLLEDAQSVGRLEGHDVCVITNVEFLRLGPPTRLASKLDVGVPSRVESKRFDEH